MGKSPPVPLGIQSGEIKACSRPKRKFSTGVGLHRGWNRWGFNQGVSEAWSDGPQQAAIALSHRPLGVRTQERT